MKITLLFLLILLPCSHVAATDQSSKALSLTIESMSSDGNIKIGFHNKTSKDIRIWSGCYSWAYFNYRVMVIRGGKPRLYCPNPNEAFTKNAATCITVKPGAMITEQLKLGAEDKWTDDTRPLLLWSGPKETRPLLQNGDKVVFTYDVRWSMESNKLDVWTGIEMTSKDFPPK